MSTRLTPQQLQQLEELAKKVQQPSGRQIDDGVFELSGSEFEKLDQFLEVCVRDVPPLIQDVRTLAADLEAAQKELRRHEKKQDEARQLVARLKAQIVMLEQEKLELSGDVIPAPRPAVESSEPPSENVTLPPMVSRPESPAEVAALQTENEHLRDQVRKLLRDGDDLWQEVQKLRRQLDRATQPQT